MFFYYTPYIDRSDLSDSPWLGEIMAPRLGHVWGFIDNVFGVCRFVLIGDFFLSAVHRSVSPSSCQRTCANDRRSVHQKGISLCFDECVASDRWRFEVWSICALHPEYILMRGAVQYQQHPQKDVNNDHSFHHLLPEPLIKYSDSLFPSNLQSKKLKYTICKYSK